MDTAKNIIAYTETIYNILKPGGVWLNLGPLVYHFAERPMESSVELTYTEWRTVMERIGFQLEKESLHKCSHIVESGSLTEVHHRCPLLKLRRPFQA